LRKWRLTTRQTVTLSYGVTLLLGASAVAMILLPLEGAMGVLVGVVLFALVVGFALKRIDMSL
jgi:hypothetical protein